MQLTERDTQVLEILTRRVRVLSVAQIARSFWQATANAPRNAAARLRTLETAAMVSLRSVLAYPEPEVNGPVCSWRPGHAAPDFGPISYGLKMRWSGPLRAQVVAIATARAGHRFGGSGGRFPRRSEISHDLGLAAVYLGLRVNEPARAAGWISEAGLWSGGGGRHEKLPDALVSLDEGDTAIEFGGAYSKAKLEEFHAYCDERHLAYEVW